MSIEDLQNRNQVLEQENKELRKENKELKRLLKTGKPFEKPKKLVVKKKTKKPKTDLLTPQLKDMSLKELEDNLKKWEEKKSKLLSTDTDKRKKVHIDRAITHFDIWIKRTKEEIKNREKFERPLFKIYVNLDVKEEEINNESSDSESDDESDSESDDESDSESDSDDENKRVCMYCDKEKDSDIVRDVTIIGYGNDNICEDCIEDEHDTCLLCCNIKRKGEYVSNWSDIECCYGCIKWSQDFQQIYGTKNGELYYEKTNNKVYDLEGEEYSSYELRGIKKDKDYKEVIPTHKICECCEKKCETEYINDYCSSCRLDFCEDCYSDFLEKSQEETLKSLNEDVENIKEEYNELEDEEKTKEELEKLCDKNYIPMEDEDGNNILDENYCVPIEYDDMRVLCDYCR